MMMTHLTNLFAKVDVEIWHSHWTVEKRGDDLHCECFRLGLSFRMPDVLSDPRGPEKISTAIKNKILKDAPKWAIMYGDKRLPNLGHEDLAHEDLADYD